MAPQHAKRSAEDYTGARSFYNFLGKVVTGFGVFLGGGKARSIGELAEADRQAHAGAASEPVAMEL